MATFILTWNPDRWPMTDDEIARDVKATAKGKKVGGRWSIGLRTGGVGIGDRAFLLRQRHDRGLVASGLFASEVFEDLHWDESGRMTTYAEVEWDTMLFVDDRLPVEILNQAVPGVHWDRMQGSGVEVHPPYDADLERLWDDHLRQLGRSSR